MYASWFQTSLHCCLVIHLGFSSNNIQCKDANWKLIKIYPGRELMWMTAHSLILWKTLTWMKRIVKAGAQQCLRTVFTVIYFAWDEMWIWEEYWAAGSTGSSAVYWSIRKPAVAFFFFFLIFIVCFSRMSFQVQIIISGDKERNSSRSGRSARSINMQLQMRAKGP